MCAHTRIRVHAYAYALARERARAHARALSGSNRNPYGFRFKPIRVSFQTRTGFKQTLYGPSKIRNAECGIRNALTVECTRYFGITVLRDFGFS